jgi:RND family efflux transporter MFP subunit
MRTVHYKKYAARWMVPLTTALMAAGCGVQDTDTAPTPTAHVQFATAVQGSLSPTALGYGTVVSAPADTRALVMPFEGAITAVLVHSGDSVRATQELLRLARTPATAAQAAQAHSALKFAEEDLARTQRLFAEKLSTNDQVATARKALADAQAQSQAIEKAGADRAQTALRAPFAGVITTLAAVPGDRPPLGTVLATVSNPIELIVQVGLQPAEAAKVASTAAVDLIAPVQDSQPVHGRLLALGKTLDSTSHLVNAVVSVPTSQSSGITLGMTLQAQVHLPDQTGIVVPRAALLEDAEGTYVFTVSDGKAHRQGVQVGVETDREVLIGDGLTAGAQVIVAGNAGLDDGIAVTQSKEEIKSDPKGNAKSEAKGEAAP